MKLPWIAWCIVLLSIALLTDCGRNPPSAPSPHSISGHLRLTGYYVDAGGRFAGTRVVGDADGVWVELLYGNRIVARTVTVDGVYRFSGLAAGGYVTRSVVIGDIGDETSVLTVANSDLDASDTLRLASRGDLYPVPNPIGLSTSVYFEIADSAWVEVRILGMAGDTVRTLAAREFEPGLHRVIWNGLDQNGIRSDAALHWITLVSGEDVRAQLLFR